MFRHTYSSTIRSLLAATVFTSLAACEADDPGPAPSADRDQRDEGFRAGPLPTGDDIGPRHFGTEPNLSAGLCPDGTSCTTIDVNDDGKHDLVRFDHVGKFGKPGTVSVGYSNGWSFGPLTPVLEDFCHKDDGCLAADVTGDSLPDMVRFVNGPETELWVAGSKPGGFEEPKLWAYNFCGPEQTCTAGDVTGDGIADLVAFAGHTDGAGTVRIYRGGKGPGFEPEVWAEGLCTDEQAACRLGDVDGDGLTDIVEFGRQPNFPITLVARSTGKDFAELEQWSGQTADRLICPAGAECQLGDFNGDFAADVIATYPEEAIESDPNSCSGSCGGSAGSCWCDDACMNYGDCCSDYTLQCGDGPPMAQEIHMWAADYEGFFGSIHLMVDMPCDPGERCWSVDFTGDGRQDLITIDASGLLEMFPSRDRVDRMLDAALRYSMLYTDHERRARRRRAEERERLIHEMVPVSPELAAALPHRFPSLAPAPAPTPTDPGLPVAPLPGLEPWPAGSPGAIDPAWVQLQLEQLSDVIELEANLLLDAIPDEGTLVSSAEQLRWQEVIGHVIAARTALYSPGLAAGPVAERRECTNAVLHDRFIADDGTTRVEGSYLSRYYDALRRHDPDDRIWSALPALTGIVEGLRCLSEPEMAGLEAAYAEAVTTTMQDLLDRSKPALAQVTWDQALPIELILFDAVKHFAKPQGWRLLQARIEGGDVVVPEFPADGTDFNIFYVEDNATCNTIRCQLYKGPHRETEIGQNLILDTFGAWLPDLTTREKLRRSSLYPELLLDAMVNFDLLGEGDCALIELNFYNRTCKSKRTCEFADELAAMPTELGVDPLPGQPGSPLTHLGTSRAGLDAANGCGSGGGGTAPTGCFGPELRGHGGRFHPLDPELDRLMYCTLEVFDGSEPTLTATEVDLNFDPACLLQDPPADGAEPPPSDSPTLDHVNVGTARNGVAAVLRGEQELHGLSQQQLIDALRASGYPFASTTDADLIAEFMNVADGMETGTFSSLLLHPAPPQPPLTEAQGPLQTRTHWSGGTLDSTTLEVDEAMFNEDLANIAATVPAAQVDAVVAEYIFKGFMHEAMHMVMHNLASDGKAMPHDVQLHHEITGRLGINRTYGRSCGPNDTSCRSGCGFGDLRVQRFTECLGGDAPPPIDRCEFAEDYCAARAEGDAAWDAGISCGSPTIDYPPLCAAVTCDGSSDLTSACCGGGGSGGTPPPFPWSPNPGPHPGDPDGPFSGIPGGPGGVPFPPLPPIF